MIEAIILITLSANALGLIVLNNHLNNLDRYFTDITNLNKYNVKLIAEYIAKDESVAQKLESKDTITFKGGSVQYHQILSEAMSERVCPDCHKMFKNALGVSMHRGKMISRGDSRHRI